MLSDAAAGPPAEEVMLSPPLSVVMPQEPLTPTTAIESK